MKTLGINIDGVIRDYLNQFDKHYRKVFVHNQNLVEMNEDFTLHQPSEAELEEMAKKIEKETNDRITLPVDTFDLLNHYQFDAGPGIEGTTYEYVDENGKELDKKIKNKAKILTPQEKLESFMYEEYPFQIFGQAEQYDNAMFHTNQIQHFGLNNKLFKTLLISKLKGQSITATYFFLSKVSSRIREVKFIEDDYQKWEDCDIVIDVMPEVFQNKPKGKISIKINHLFNQWDEADYSFDSIKYINDEEFLRKIFQ